jgi:hypothetical protein
VETFTVALVGGRSRAWNDGVVGDETRTWSGYSPAKT